MPADGNSSALPDTFIAAIRDYSSKLVVFSVVRNEKMRINAWLRHYRNMGVNSFAVIDNGSTDGTYETLQQQSDVLAIRLDTSYATSYFGISWLNELHQRLIVPRWVLFADADELLVYKGWPHRPLSELLDQAELTDCNAFFGIMLDMYPNGPLEDAIASGEDSLFDVASCFDRDYHFRIRPSPPWRRDDRKLELIGGPRLRMLSSSERELEMNWLIRLIGGQIERILSIAPDPLVPWVVRLMPKQMPALCKTPLVRSGEGVTYTSAHYTRGARLFRENIVLCHFKFLADFAARVRAEAARGEHYRRGAEYIMYADAIAKKHCLELTYEGSQIFRTVDQFVELGLIRDIYRLLAEKT